MSPISAAVEPWQSVANSPYGSEVDDSGTSMNSPVWIAITIASGVILTVALIVLAVFICNKHRRRQNPEQTNPYSGSGQFATSQKIMSSAGLAEEEELQRQFMIRKSLATRSWNTIESQASMRTTTETTTETTTTAMTDQIERQTMDIEDEEDAEARNLRDDWKAWEARVQHERSMSGELHPAIDCTVPALRLPQPPSRTRSLTCPPVPPRHPGRLRAT
ncbi:hypothetical protein B0T26DRAFT_749474 [Lasiosphaeria miniovina]|uniref:Uncharacterized protein n=1 Tax=Lasiosphaeria miniovina TaxID=1954250 RepID=A0AA40DZ83_9PEZI|nr:uncharacterized protein B0T26DRAFT_749474 [Lasiosphaeria miniovina]KAK0722014.1 hypothetical protein B0T26DRAFT_749474 [Lasiosphaeria miniovina]